MELFRFDRAKAAKSIEDPDGALWPVNAFSDADELNALMEAARNRSSSSPRGLGPTSTSTRSRSASLSRCSPSIPAPARPCSAAR
jgi:hypothetical protein